MDLVRCLFRSNYLSALVGHSSRQIRTSAVAFDNKDRARDRRDLLRGLPVVSQGDEGKDDILPEKESETHSFPDEDTPNQLFDGVPYSNLPILHMKVSKNNTLFTLVDLQGKMLIKDSAGRCGFKNCRKGTTVAAQSTGESMAGKMLRQGYKTVRVCVRGLGPGRIAAVKSLAASGITVASISDTTPYDEYPPRPRAAKSL